MNKILITGASGQLGRALNQLLQTEPDVSITNTDVFENKNDSVICMDITNQDEVIAIITEKNPDIIINCAAHTAVDLCESEEDKAYKINAIGPKNLATAAEKINAVLVQISTDYVFDGEGNTPITEECQANPRTVYGNTKLQGEKFVQDICSKYFIIRTAWLYGNGKNFIKTMLRLSENNDEIRVVNDQYGTPTSALELARMILALLKTDAYGIYHGTCEGSTTWYEFAVEIFRLMQKDTKVIPITTNEYPVPAKRPKYSVLENEKLKKVAVFQFKNWKEALEEYLQDIK